MLRIGIAQTRIQTEPDLDLTGYLVITDRRAKGSHDDLFIKALVLDDGDTEAGIVACDLVGLDIQFVRRVGRQIERRIGISKDNIIIATTHTHSAPATIGLRGCGQVNQQWLNTLQKDIVATVGHARDNLKEAEIGTGSGITREVSINRRIKTTDGNIRMIEDNEFYNPNDMIDPEVGVVKFEDRNGEVIGMLVNFACHPVVLGPDNRLISADYPGYMMKKVSSELNGTVMFTNGACGDINPQSRGTFQETERMGNILAQEVLKVTKKIGKTLPGKLKIKKKTVELFFQLPSLSELQKEIRLHEAALKKLNLKESLLLERGTRKVFLEWAREKLDIIQRQKPRGIKIEIKVLAINDTVLIAIPAEVFVEIGLTIKKNSPFKYTFILCYANGCVGYIPSWQAYQEGGYEIDAAYKHYNSFPFTSGVGDKVKKIALSLAEDIKASG